LSRNVRDIIIAFSLSANAVELEAFVQDGIACGDYWRKRVNSEKER